MTEAATSAERDPIQIFLATHGLATLRLVCSVWLGYLALVGGSHYVHHGDVNPTAYLGFALIVMVMVLAQRGRLRLAFGFFLWGGSLVVALGAVSVAGLQTPGLIALPLLATLTGWLLGARQGWLMLAVNGGFLLALAWAQQRGMLPPPIARAPGFIAMAYLGAAAVGTVVGIGMAQSIREQYGRVVGLSEQLQETNAHLEELVAARTSELSATLERLRQTQDDLIQSEKLASLGSMVAGITHELNTPIGNAVTVVSTLTERAQALDAALQTGALKRSELASGLGGMVEMAGLIDRSVQRAAALVASFKQVAVDQVSERRRVFDLRAVIDENLEALRPGIKDQPWQIENLVPAGISCDSFPGPLGQVLTNLIQNAVFHGFSGRDHGRLQLMANVNDGMLELIVADDGIGMDTATAVRIFEPFFTTRLGKGGSGLGLAVCYRIVTTILAGDIHVQSSPGTGTQFVVRMPLRTPGKI